MNVAKKIVIAGAGIGGLCAALALAKKGFDVSVYEKSAHIAEVGAGLQLSPNAMHVLRELGLVDALEGTAFRPQSAVMRHFQNGKTYFTVPLGQRAVQKYGADYLHIHRADLHIALMRECEKLKVKVHLGQAIQGYDQDGPHVNVHFNQGESVGADVLVGADGIKSVVQACMLGSTPSQFTGQVAWRGVIDSKKLPKGLIAPNANLWVGPGKHFVSYYLRGGDLINFVAVQERNDWHNESWNEKGDVHELRAAFTGWHSEVSRLLEAASDCFLWALFDRPPLQQWSQKNVTLLGDACHPMLPFVAQGAAMAIEDSFVLAQCLTDSENTQEALKKYESLRLPRTASIQQNARKNAALYHMSSPIEKAKLSILSGLSGLGLSDKMAASKLDYVYGHNVVTKVS
jgi:salicylate hydroxylase